MFFFPKDNLFNGSSTTAAHPGDPQELEVVCPVLKQDHVGKASLGWLLNEARCKTGWTRVMDKCRSQGSHFIHCPGLALYRPGTGLGPCRELLVTHCPSWLLQSCISVSHMVIRLHTALPLWLLLKPVPDLFTLTIRNLFISSPTTLSLVISQDFLTVSLLPCVSQ